MKPSKPSDYTTGELSIVVSNLTDKFDEMKLSVDDKFTGIKDSIVDLTAAVNDINTYKAEISGMMRSTIFWAGVISSIIVFLGGSVVSMFVSNIESRIIKQTEEHDKSSSKMVIDYIDARLEGRNVIPL